MHCVKNILPIYFNGWFYEPLLYHVVPQTSSLVMSMMGKLQIYANSEERFHLGILQDQIHRWGKWPWFFPFSMKTTYLQICTKTQTTGLKRLQLDPQKKNNNGCTSKVIVCATSKNFVQLHQKTDVCVFQKGTWSIIKLVVVNHTKYYSLHCFRSALQNLHINVGGWVPNMLKSG